MSNPDAAQAAIDKAAAAKAKKEEARAIKAKAEADRKQRLADAKAKKKAEAEKKARDDKARKDREAKEAAEENKLNDAIRNRLLEQREHGVDGCGGIIFAYLAKTRATKRRVNVAHREPHTLNPFWRQFIWHRWHP